MHFSRHNHDSVAFASTLIPGSLSFSSREGKEREPGIEVAFALSVALAMDVVNLPFWMEL